MHVIALVLHRFAKIRILLWLFTVSMSFLESLHYSCHTAIQFSKLLKKQYKSDIRVCHSVQNSYE